RRASTLRIGQFLILMLPPPRSSALFPYTTLFRSQERFHLHVGANRHAHEIWQSREEATNFDSATAQRAKNRSDLAAQKLVASSRSEEHTSELQSRRDRVCRLLLEETKNIWSLVEW